jgi:energy-coupling factor transporter ATP-binding protein EcfA2
MTAFRGNTMSTRQFVAKHAVREAVPLLIGLFGPSGSGKTYSALRLATGIKTLTGGKIFAIDTEARRMLHYADTFDFEHVQFDAPFGSLDYLAVIRQCVDAGASVVIVDSCSHEHEGPGGLLDTHEKELDRLAGSDYAKRERVKMLAWQKPKAARRQLINGILQLNANMIFCFRAKESVRPVRINGKTEVVPMGFMPIAGDEFVYEQTVNCLLLPASGGVPTWQSEAMGERQMVKLPQQFREIFAEHKPLDEDTGRRLAEWARGEQAPAGEDDLSTKITTYDNELGAAAAKGTAALKQAWEAIPRELRQTLKAALDRRHKATAIEADKANISEEFA